MGIQVGPWSGRSCWCPPRIIWSPALTSRQCDADNPTKEKHPRGCSPDAVCLFPDNFRQRCRHILGPNFLLLLYKNILGDAFLVFEERSETGPTLGRGHVRSASSKSSNIDKFSSQIIRLVKSPPYRMTSKREASGKNSSTLDAAVRWTELQRLRNGTFPSLWFAKKLRSSF